MSAEQLQQMQNQFQELAYQFQQSQVREQALTAELTRLLGLADMPNIFGTDGRKLKELSRSDAEQLQRPS